MFPFISCAAIVKMYYKFLLKKTQFLKCLNCTDTHHVDGLFFHHRCFLSQPSSHELRNVASPGTEDLVALFH